MNAHDASIDCSAMITQPGQVDDVEALSEQYRKTQKLADQQQNTLLRRQKNITTTTKVKQEHESAAEAAVHQKKRTAFFADMQDKVYVIDGPGNYKNIACVRLILCVPSSLCVNVRVKSICSLLCGMALLCSVKRPYVTFFTLRHSYCFTFDKLFSGSIKKSPC